MKTQNFATIMCILLWLLLLSGCGVLDSAWKGEFTSPVYRFGIALKDRSEYNLTDSKMTCFARQIDAYTKRLLEEFEATGGLRFIWIGDRAVRETNHTSVRIAPVSDLEAAGIWIAPGLIVIREDQNFLAVFGHEFVRVIFYRQGDHEAAYASSSVERAGTVGEWWNIADNIAALEFATCGVQ